MGAIAINPEPCADIDFVPHLCLSPEIPSPADQSSSSGGRSRRRLRLRQPLRRSPEAFGAGPSPPAVFHSRDELRGISVLVATPPGSTAADAATPVSTHSTAPPSSSSEAAIATRPWRSVEGQGPSLLRGAADPHRTFVASSPEELREAGIETDDAMVAVAFPGARSHPHRIQAGWAGLSSGGDDAMVAVAFPAMAHRSQVSAAVAAVSLPRFLHPARTMFCCTLLALCFVQLHLYPACMCTN